MTKLQKRAVTRWHSKGQTAGRVFRQSDPAPLPPRITYIHAILPRETQRVASMAHEFPPEPISEAAEHEITEFIALCLECGAMGFFVEEVTLRGSH